MIPNAASHPRRWIAVLAVAAAACAAGCGTDFDPASYLKDLRVLAISSDRLEAGPGETVTLRPEIYTPPGTTVSSVSWSFCPVTLGAAVGFRCIDPRCETPLTADAERGVTANPSALAQACLATLVSSGTDGGTPAVDPANLPQTVDTVFRLTVTASDGAVEEVIQRFELWPFETPTARNRPVVIRGITVNGVPPDASGTFAAVAPLAEVTVEVEIDPDSLDAFTDSDGVPYTEDPVVSFYATAGRFEQDRANGLRGSVTWKAEKLADADTETVLYAVARDLRGGQTITGPYRIPITRGP